MIAAVVIAVATLSQSTVASVSPEPSDPPVTATSECEEAVDAILADWQEISDEWADVPFEEFVAEDRIYNITEVPIGGPGCEPLTATTIATDRAGELDAGTSTAAVVRGLILADVGEMVVFGPGLDLDVPTTPAGPDVSADLDSLIELAPAAGAQCDEWEEFAVAVVHESVDLSALATSMEMFDV